MNESNVPTDTSSSTIPEPALSIEKVTETEEVNTGPAGACSSSSSS